MKIFTINNTKWTVFAIFIAIAASLCSCDYLPAECSSYLESPFRADAEGEINGERISAELYCDPTEHKTKEIYNRLIITFKSGKGLEGITVSLRSDGLATVRLRGTTEELPLYSGLAQPFTALCPQSEPYAIRKTEGGCEIEYRDGDSWAILFFDESGVIKRVNGEILSRHLDLNVTNFEQIPK